MNLFDPSGLVSAALLVRLGVAPLVWIARRHPAAARLALLGSILASALTATAAVTTLRHGARPETVLFLHRASGLGLTTRLDGVSAWFLIVLAAIAIPAALFAIGYVEQTALRRRAAFVGLGANWLIGTVELVFAAADVVTFLLAWEMMTLLNAALVTTEHESAASRRAAFLYLVMAHVGTGCLFAGFLVLASVTGSASFATALAAAPLSGGLRDVLFVLFFLGFAVKAGVVPLHVWLPEAHPAAPSPISALMSGVLIKTGIYGIVRVCIFGLGTPALGWGVVVVTLGGASAVLGVLYALIQHDLKRLLAYHSIENIGIILLGLGAGMIGLATHRPGLALLGLSAGLFHVLNHALFKCLLFLSAGNVVSATSERDLERFGGVLRLMPWTGAVFLIGAMAISGLPPFNGFASEWLTFQALLDGARGSDEPLVRFLFPIGGALLALTTALAAACFVKAFGMTFLARPRSDAAARAREAGAWMRLPPVALAAACLLLGVWPGLAVGPLTSRVLPDTLSNAAALNAGGLQLSSGPIGFDHVTPAVFGIVIVVVVAVAGLAIGARGVRRAPTWGCGGVLTAGTEYTATAFSKPLLMIFRAIYRPTREVEALARVSPYFTQEVRYRTAVEPTFERFLYAPITRGVLRTARMLRVLQAGSLQAYLAYVMVLVVSLVLLIWWRS